MKTVLLLLTSDFFSLPLIRYLVWEGRRYRWKICVGSMLDHDPEWIKKEKCSNDVIFISITSLKQCDHAIRKADLIIGQLPDALLLQVTERCIAHGKSLVTPSTIDSRRLPLRFQMEDNPSLILSECGFSPGMDHVTAMKAIETIQRKGGNVLSFKTFSGSLLASDCIDNPWEYKLTEPCQDMIHLGKYINRHLIHGEIQHVPYHQLFSRAEPVLIPGLNNAMAIPAGDALYYQKIYGLNGVETIVKGKIIRSGFENIWNLLIKLGLTDDQVSIDMKGKASFFNFLNSLLPYSKSESVEYKLVKYLGASSNDIQKLKWLGLFKKEWVGNKVLASPAAVLQHLLEENLSLKREDKDCIAMLHQLQYKYRDEWYNFEATLVTEGENLYDSAIAKAVALTTGAAAKAFLLGNIKLKGFHRPIAKEIYDSVLDELDELGMAFHIKEKRHYRNNEDINYNFNLN